MNDFLEKSYYFELERKDKLNAAVAFPLGLAAISANLIYYAIDKGSVNQPFWCLTVFFLSIGAVLLLLLAFRGFKFLMAFQYKYVGKTEQFVDWMTDLVKHKQQYPTSQDPQITFNLELAKSFARSADHNATNNDGKSTLLYFMNTFAAASLVFSICGSGIVALSVKSTEKPTEVRVYG